MSLVEKPELAHKPTGTLGGTDPQRDELLALGRGLPLPRTQLPLIHELVAEVGRVNPDTIALSCEDFSVTYRRLLDWADEIGVTLAAHGGGPGGRVAILAEPSAAMVAAVLGILRRGAAYVPIDPSQPRARISQILDDARACVVLVAGDDARANLDRDVELPVLEIDAIVQTVRQAQTVDSGVPHATAADDVAYVIYTSGSTGEPKGVVVEHGQFAASNFARLSVYPGPSVFLLVSPLAFDSSAAGMWSTLSSGGTLVVAARDEVHDPERLVELIERQAVTRTLCTPSLYGSLLDAAAVLGVGRLDTLEMVILAGESLPRELLNRHFDLFPSGVALFNECGATETAVWATVHRFDSPGPVSIGGPIPGANLYVLDESLDLVPRGAEGELVIGGAVVARGYLGRPDATRRAFLDDPFAGVEAARMYRTGDVVRWNETGTLDYIGRRDQQVKIRGHRVELTAVEATLRTLPGIRDAVVVANDERTTLTAFVTARPPWDVDLVRRHLADLLPPAMVPSMIRVLDALPLTFSGKVDRRRLQKLAGNVSAPPLAAENDTLAASVAMAWCEVLNVQEVASDVNFFDCGGHSLAMFQLRDALERHTGVRPSLVDLFRHPSVSDQVALVERELAGRTADAGVAAESRRARPREREG